ncbi:MAG: FeoB-associated Cys-rich membrane protein [Armatimonadetes bacterium]|nr:FeoB-associated Cys-rich membrane protein [Armatimonadota bacterium]MDE2206922.1 FeoB-associated Cys-rich membrane protein [Armatimonadota bacterium]
MWQNIVTALLVAAAALYVARTLYRMLRPLLDGKSNGCGCGSCQLARAAKAPRSRGVPISFRKH